MAINVNAVYTTVLSILNKEQRGYLTPYEFGQIATQVQLEIFEKFFEDYNQYLRMPKTDVEFASRMDHVREEFQIFEKNENASAVSSNAYSQPTDLNRFGSASWNIGKNSPPIEIVSNRDYNKLKLSPLTQPTNNFPVGKYQQDKLTVFPSLTPSTISDVTFNYIRKPNDVRWGYIEGGLGQYIYDPTLPVFTLKSQADLTSYILKDVGSNLTNSILNFTIGTTPGVTTSGSGVGGDIIITIENNKIKSIIVSNSLLGLGYQSGDIITVTPSALEGAQSDLQIKLNSLVLSYLNSGGSIDFEISESQQTETVLEILKYAGVVIRDPQIVQVASQELQQEEINSKR